MQDTITEVHNKEVAITDSVCRNCDSVLTGDYCSRCGQNESKRDIHFFDLIGEYLGDIFVWKSGLWKTLLSLLFRPGFISMEYFEGRRARYLPPLRLYVVISFLMFLLISFTSRDSTVVVSGEQNNEATQQETDSATSVADTQNVSDAVNLDFWDANEKPQWATDLEQRLQANISSIEENPSVFLESFIDRLPYLMFLLLPLFAVLIKIVYLFSPYHYLQHLVFSLHYHSALFLLFSFALALDELIDYQFGKWIFLWCIIYLPLALSKAYGSSFKSALGKSLVVGAGETMMLIAILSILAIVSVVTL
ncbi:MAG: DUF3667 domain-containing protein [Halioglobus sp.]